MTSVAMSFHVLGPLDVRLGEDSLELAGAKQRAVLAVLLLRAGEVVPVERLVDEVWGDDPPPSAAHTLESYVSRLRQLFSGHGPRLVRKGAGYALELGDATLDARRFAELQEQASLASAMEEHAGVVELTAAALAMWSGPALADVALASAGRAEADRLEELRLRTHELRFDAELALGQHDRAIGELQALVTQNPYRERFVAQLMLALYRCGRHAEALDAYEQTRRRLADDLGLQPSADLQQLSGQIVRQDPQLKRPAPAQAHPSPIPTGVRRTRRLTELVLVGSIVAAVMAFTASGSAPPPLDAVSASEVQGGIAPESLTTPRAALVAPKSTTDRVLAGMMVRTLRSAESTWDVDVRLLQVDETSDDDRDRLVRRIERSGFALVVAVGDSALATSIASVVADMPATTFAFVDVSLADLELAGAANAYSVRFADEHASQLVGYLAALVRTHRKASERVDTVSVVSGPLTPQRERALEGFKQGVKNARPDVSVLVGYAKDTSDPTECEQLANEQIDRGSDVVFVDAGSCGLGAITVARIRSVWAVGAESVVPPGSHVLATTYKNVDQAVFAAIQDFILKVPRAGEDLVLGLDDDYAVGVEHVSHTVPEALWSKVVAECSKIRQGVAASES